MPIYNWIMIHKGEIHFLIEERGKFPGNEAEAWQKLLNQYYARYGMTAAFKQHLRKMKQLTILVCENAIKFDVVKNIRIQALEAEISKYTDEGETVDFFENVAALSKFVGYRVDPKSMSVSEYVNNINLMTKAAKHFNLKGKHE